MGLKDIFRKKLSYKIDETKAINKEKQKKEAIDLSGRLFANVFMYAYGLKPIDKNNLNKVKLPDDIIEIIKEFINSENEMIKKNLQKEEYCELKDKLQQIIIDNEDGIILDSEFMAAGNMAKIFWEEFWDKKDQDLVANR